MSEIDAVRRADGVNLEGRSTPSGLTGPPINQGLAEVRA